MRWIEKEKKTSKERKKAHGTNKETFKWQFGHFILSVVPHTCVVAGFVRLVPRTSSATKALMFGDMCCVVFSSSSLDS